MVSGVQKMAEMKLSSRSLRKKNFKNFLWVFTTENWTCPQNQNSGFGLFGQFSLNPVLRTSEKDFFTKNRFSGVFAEILTYIVGDL